MMPEYNRLLTIITIKGCVFQARYTPDSENYIIESNIPLKLECGPDQVKEWKYAIEKPTDNSNPAN